MSGNCSPPVLIAKVKVSMVRFKVARLMISGNCSPPGTDSQGQGQHGKFKVARLMMS